MSCSRYIVYSADPDQDGGWLEETHSHNSLLDVMQEVGVLLDPTYAPSPTRVAIYQLVEVIKEEPTEPEG